MQLLPERRSKLYGDLAFGILVLAAFSQFLFARRLDMDAGRVGFVFLLGAIYTALGVFHSELGCGRTRPVVHLYYVIQCLIAATAVILGPTRGVFFILTLAVISQSTIDYGWRGTALITGGLFVASVAPFWRDHGREVALEIGVAYLPAFIFTLVISVIAKEATAAKYRAESLAAELTAANAQLRANAAQAEELAVTRERNRVAREIHDGVGHYLTVIKVQLDAAHALLPSDPVRAAASVDKAARLAGEALDDVRRSVGSLATDAERPPLTETLRQLAADAAPRPRVEIEGTPRLLPAAAEHALYRTAQEGLTNLRKHAAAQHAVLTLDFRDAAQVRLTLVDDGRGDHGTAPAGPNGSGYGLRGLRERIALLGGTLSAGNRPEGGFVLRAEVPA